MPSPFLDPIASERRGGLDSQGIDVAVEGIRALDAALLEGLRLAESPRSEEERESVEAVALMLGVRPDFGSAQVRLMTKEEALRERMLSFDKAKVPPTAHVKLRKFMGGAATEPLAAALREWVVALLKYGSIAAEAEMAREQTKCTAAMQAGCECLCDLHGLHDVEEDLLGELHAHLGEQLQHIDACLRATSPYLRATSPDRRAISAYLRAI